MRTSVAEPSSAAKVPDSVLAGGLVAAQAALLAVLAVPATPAAPVRRWRRVAGAAFVLGGAAVMGLGARSLGPALTASPLPRTSSELSTGGIYGLVRHPIYGGLLLAAAGRSLASSAPRHAVATGCLLGLLRVKSGFEETRLRARFPAYRAYAGVTPRLLPGPAALRRTRSRCGS